MEAHNIKSIEQLIKYLNERYLISKDSTNLGEELESMREMKKVPSIVKKCKRIKYKIRWEPYYIRDNNTVNTILWTYLNECILSCYERSNSKSTKNFRHAYINVRQVGNETNIKERLVEIATSRGLDVSKTFHKIDEALGKYFHYKQEIRQYPHDSNGYSQILPEIKEVVNCLVENGYIPSELYYDLQSNSLESDVLFNYCLAENKDFENEEILAKSKIFDKDALWGCVVCIILVLLIFGIVFIPLITVCIIALLIIIGVVIRKYRNNL